MEFHDPVDKSLFYIGMQTVSPLAEVRFVVDSGYPFSDVLFYGNEWSLFSLDVLLFSVSDLAAQNYVLAAVITFTVSQVTVNPLHY